MYSCGANSDPVYSKIGFKAKSFICTKLGKLGAYATLFAGYTIYPV